MTWKQQQNTSLRVLSDRLGLNLNLIVGERSILKLYVLVERIEWISLKKNVRGV